MSPADIHPAVRSWFNSTFENETPVQAAAWKEIRSGKNVLIAAPTGSGKTFAAFLCAINDLVQQSEQRQSEQRQSEQRPLADSVQVLYHYCPVKTRIDSIASLYSTVQNSFG